MKIILFLLAIPFMIYYGMLTFFWFLNQQIVFQMNHPVLTLWGPPMLLVLAIVSVPMLIVRHIVRQLAPKKMGKVQHTNPFNS